MMLRFAVSNHCSICEEQEISLVASSLKDFEDGLIDTEALRDLRVLPAIIIYGANASGKSNLIDALSTMKTIVLDSHSKGKPGGKIPRRKFALRSECGHEPTSMEAEFVVEGIRYQYGFEFFDDKVEAEWLFSYPHGRRRSLFEREKNKFVFGRSLKGQNRVISALTRRNSLFVSAATQNDHEDLVRINNFFQDLEIERSVSLIGPQVSFAIGEHGVDERAVRFLGEIGTGVVDYRRSSVPIPDEINRMRKAIEKALSEAVGDDFSLGDDDTEEKIQLGHETIDGAAEYFDLDWESAGTRRLLVLMGRVFRALDEGATIIVDELDASLHTHACEAVLALFSSRSTNPLGAQMIATTHDTNLLRSSFLRRDQIWFTEKDRRGATEVFPLTDIATRRGDNIETGYLQGRFGALPFVKSIKEFLMGYETCPEGQEKS